MRRRALALAAGAALAPAVPAAATSPLGVRVDVQPRAVRFGDVVTAEIDLAHGTLERPALNALPFSVTAVHPLGGHGVRFTLTCLTEACLPDAGPRVVRLHPVRVTGVVDGKRVTTTAVWPAVRIASRLTAADRKGPLRFRSPKVPPAPRYGVAPGMLAALLIALATLCALGAVALVVLTARRLARRPAREPRLSPLELAIAFLRDSTRRPAPDRRRALELLAETVATDPELAGAAAERAWSEQEPSPAAAAELADRAAALRGKSR